MSDVECTRVVERADCLIIVLELRPCDLSDGKLVCGMAGHITQHSGPTGFYCFARRLVLSGNECDHLARLSLLYLNREGSAYSVHALRQMPRDARLEYALPVIAILVCHTANGGKRPLRPHAASLVNGWRGKVRALADELNLPAEGSTKQKSLRRSKQWTDMTKLAKKPRPDARELENVFDNLRVKLVSMQQASDLEELVAATTSEAR